MPQFISITDVPISTSQENLLGIENYAQALSNFILHSATPLIIGIQGEWGTGKTSLMNLIQENLADYEIATSWVNTWEYSLFKQSGETTPAVLRGMLEKLKESCGDQWTISKSFAENITKKLWKFGSSVANQLSKSHLDVDIKEAIQDGDGPLAIYTEIASVKKEIAELIQKLIDDPKNKYKRVAFFLDDLDRIEPPIAVEILEALKNVFDIPNCIFVLAIDYEVVIKGLEKKFGVKTEKNEREFRSFFDKIIQVPFTMPVGAYKIETLLKQKFQDLNLTIDGKLDKNYLKLVSLTVGYNPRSIKRYINTYSLLKQIVQLSQGVQDQLTDFCLFALLGIQISYPIIFRLINQNPDFLAWDEKIAKKYDIIEDLSKPPLEGEKYTDEPWEIFLYFLCQKDSYLKPRTLNAIEILNVLRDQCGNDLKNRLNRALEFASITAVDDHEESKQVKGVDQEARQTSKQLMVDLTNKLNNKFADLLSGKHFQVYQARGEEWASVYLFLIFDANNNFSAELSFSFWNKDYQGYIARTNKKSDAVTRDLINSLKKSISDIEEGEDEPGKFYFFDSLNEERILTNEYYNNFEEDVFNTMDQLVKLGVFKN